MNGYLKKAIWVLGLIALGFLILFPISQIETTWKSWSLPLSGKTIVIDPGHGGPDGGAVAKDDTTEKEIALAVSKKLQTYLQQSGAMVYLTREADYDLAAEDTKGLSKRKSEDIRKRLDLIHDKQADFFVSVHLNSIPSERWSGAQTFYNPNDKDGHHLAKMIQTEIIDNLDNTTRTALAMNTIYLLKHAEVPGALVEIGFLSNDQEREQLKQESYQEQMAASIYEGMLRYATEDPEQAKN